VLLYHYKKQFDMNWNYLPKLSGTKPYRSIFGLAVLIAAAYIGNFLSLPLLFGVDFLFGSIAVLVAIHLYGTFWGTLVAIIASWHTFIQWGHPYAMIIFFGEALFVGLLLGRNSIPIIGKSVSKTDSLERQNLVLLDGIYWVFIGIPLVWLFYGGGLCIFILHK
jgi:hypothetical protein